MTKTAAEEFGTDPAGNLARYERNVNMDTSGVGGGRFSVGSVGMPVQTLTGGRLGSGVGARYTMPVGGRAKGGSIKKTKKMAKGGSTASKRADGCCTKGKTKGKFV